MEPISAVATAQGKGGVAIVRLSGDNVLELARKMFSRKGEFVPNTMYAGKIDCGGFTDYGFMVYFRAPVSFTGEDVVEFHCHGGTEICRGILKRTVELGARLAERGEFTKRAFLNGKLSLSAAEGMVDMINAQSSAEVRAGFLLYGEKLTKEGKRLQGLLKTCLAGVDADLDYPEEDLSFVPKEELISTLEGILSELNSLVSGYRAGRKIKSGVSVAICGRPNAGKSSLLNALLGYDRAIVSPVEGTTRDIVEGTIELGGVLFRLTDTAGLRDGQDEIEREGIRRAEQAISGADLILFVRDGDEEEPVFQGGVPVIRVASKSDLSVVAEGDIHISSVTGEGISELKNMMYERGFGRENDGEFLLEERHYFALKKAAERVSSAISSLKKDEPCELAAADMTAAFEELGVISGETASKAVIDEIFDKFCVGK